MDISLTQVYDECGCVCNKYCCYSAVCPWCANASITSLISEKMVQNREVEFVEFSYCYDNWWKDCIISTLCDAVSYRVCCCSTCAIITRRRRFSKTNNAKIDEFKKELPHVRCGENLRDCFGCNYFCWKVTLLPCCIVAAEKEYLDTLPDNNKVNASRSQYEHVSMSDSIVAPGDRFSVI